GGRKDEVQVEEENEEMEEEAELREGGREGGRKDEVQVEEENEDKVAEKEEERIKCKWKRRMKRW
ncbi:hypothetical protein KPH14_000306, partial [Odynerus spinipes]